MWAVCRYDHRMSWDEFQDMTLAQFEALEDRRATAIRHARFNAALITSALVNVNLSGEADALSPFDFLPGYELDPEEIEKAKLRKSTKRAIALHFAQMPGASMEEVLEEKARVIQRLTASGIEDAEELIREVYPDL